MQIAGSSIRLPPLQTEPLRDRSGGRASEVEGRVVEAPLAEPVREVEDLPSVERVAEPSEAEPPRSYPVPVRMSVDGRHVRQALATYETVMQLQRGVDLHALMGVDLYA